MSNEHRENEIDEIFRRALEPVETEPSEQFWHKAAEDVIARGNTLAPKSTSRWKIIAFILGAGLLVLGYFSYNLENGLKKAELQIASVKSSANQNRNKSVSSEKILNNSVKNNVATIQDKKLSVIKQTVYSAKLKKTATKNIDYSSNSKQRNANSHSKSSITMASKTLTSKVNKQAKTPTQAIAKADKNEIITHKEENNTGIVKQENPTSNNLDIPENKTTSPNQAQKKTDTNSIGIVEQARQNKLKTTQPISVSLSDTSKVTAPLIPPPNISKFSISGFFSPDFMLAYKFKSTDPAGTQCETSIKADEEQNFSYSTGLKAEFAISSRFSIGTGIAYQVYSFNIKPSILYAQWQPNGDLGYSITTSSGVLQCPDYGTTYSGDSLKMSASSSRSYIEIPLEVKYNFLAGERCNLYCDIGMEANIYMMEKTTMSWQDYWNQSGVSTVTGTQGLKSIYLSYCIGIGLDYKISKTLSIYIEPGLHEAITPLDDNTSVITYPRLVSITGGLTYHIN